MKIDKYYEKISEELKNKKTYSEKREFLLHGLVDALTGYVEVKDDIRNLESMYKINKINMKTSDKYKGLKTTQQRDEIHKDLFNDEQDIIALKYERDCFEAMISVLNIMLDDVDD